MPATPTIPYRLGCPMWGHRHWVGRLFSPDADVKDFLAQYSSVFNAVEGNTTFYGLPTEETVARWNEEAADNFRFCFKFPRQITHSLKLQHAQDETKEFFDRMEPLGDKLGPFLLQLPPEYGPDELTGLANYLSVLPAAHRYTVEVRHPHFFTNESANKSLSDLLENLRMDRVMFDSRPLFSVYARTEAVKEAQRKKPRLPAYTFTLARHPTLRFVGHPTLEKNKEYFRVWLRKLAKWIDAGLEPYIFMHMAEKTEAPALADAFHSGLKGYSKAWQRLPPIPIKSKKAPAKTQANASQEKQQLDLF
ncbi:MAG: DUF72 domain-containing protein [Pseudomonadales bacterium]